MSDEVLDSVKKCVAVIKGAKTDTEKFAALFMVTKTVKAEKCNARSKLALFDAVEFKFIKRLLLSDDVPAGCPPFVYKSVAMSILTALCSVQEVATHQEILQNVDVFLDIVLGAEDEDEDEADEDNLMLVNEAYKCLNVIAQFEQGMRALFEVDAVGKMCKVYSQKSFQTDEALSLLVAIVEKFGPPSWENNVPNFNTLMNILTVDFETDHSDRKFKLCSILSPLLGNCPVEIAQNTCNDEIWPTKMFLGLRDILTSKLVKAQRDPAIKLAAQMLTTFGAEWSLQDEAKPKAFFLLLIHLASIEIRMLLEDKKFEQVNRQYTYIILNNIILLHRVSHEAITHWRYISRDNKENSDFFCFFHTTHSHNDYEYSYFNRTYTFCRIKYQYLQSLFTRVVHSKNRHLIVFIISRDFANRCIFVGHPVCIHSSRDKSKGNKKTSVRIYRADLFIYFFFYRVNISNEIKNKTHYEPFKTIITFCTTYRAGTS